MLFSSRFRMYAYKENTRTRNLVKYQNAELAYLRMAFPTKHAEVP